MTREEIVRELKKYFRIDELVCNHTFAKFGELSWQFLDTELLETLLILRTKIFKQKMFVNGNGYTQRGLRCNLCQLVKDKTDKGEIYLSSHVNGAGEDIDVDFMTAEEARNEIKKNQHLLPYPVRIEKNVSWLHIDVYDSLNGQKVTEFNG